MVLGAGEESEVLVFIVISWNCTVYCHILSGIDVLFYVIPYILFYYCTGYCHIIPLVNYHSSG
jgi:hypothetical protein